MEAQGPFAQALSERSFGGKAFFCNSGAEANEAAIKLARLHGAKAGRSTIVTMTHGFHGRTYAALTATAQPKYHEGCGPMLPGFRYVPYDDLDRRLDRHRRARPPRSSSSRSRAKGASTCRRPAIWRGSARSATSGGPC